MDHLIKTGGAQRDSKFMLMRYSFSWEHSFVIGRIDPPPEGMGLDPDVELHVLNEDRLELTLNHRIPVPRLIEAQWVNSIFRPTLPDDSIWKLRKR